MGEDDEVWKSRSNINKIRQMALTDGNADNIEILKVATLTEIHEQLWWLALMVKINIVMIILAIIAAILNRDKFVL